MGASLAANVNSRTQQRSDEDLARESQAGSLVAFEELVFRYERRIYGFVLQFCGNSADAAEIAQESFLKAFRNIAQYNPRRSFPGWLFTIARHHCIDYHRAAPPFAETTPPEDTVTVDPAESLATQEERDSLWSLAGQVLPSAQFQALWLTYAEGMRAKEIARVMGRTNTYVKVMLFRARRTLRRALEESRSDVLSIRPPSTPEPSTATAEGHFAALHPRKPWTLAIQPTRATAARQLKPT
jgi:RNA polymerase sigma-70 factor (ECF subfamily)